jgi:hypothetical protein
MDWNALTLGSLTKYLPGFGERAARAKFSRNRLPKEGDALSEGNPLERLCFGIHGKKVLLILLVSVSLCFLCWVWTQPTSGFNYETTFSFLADNWEGKRSWFYSDPARPFNSTPYQVGYVVSALSGFQGSALGHQIVLLILNIVFASCCGFFYYFVSRNFYPALFATAVAATWSADHATNWIGQLNQFSVRSLSALALLSVFIFTRSTGRILQLLFWFTGLFSFFIASMSHEAAIPFLWGSFIALCMLLIPAPMRSKTFLSFSPPLLVATIVTVESNLRSTTYGASLLRNDLSPISICRDLWTMARTSFDFRLWLPELDPLVSDILLVQLMGTVALAIFLYGRNSRSSLVDTPKRTHHRRCMAYCSHTRFLVFAVISLGASFAGFVVLENPTMPWRTLILSSWPTSILFGLILHFVLNSFSQLSVSRKLISRRSFFTYRKRFVFFFNVLTLVLSVVLLGVFSARHHGQVHRERWSEFSSTFQRILIRYPSVPDGTVFILQGVSSTSDPFGHNMWFDVGVRLAYPGQVVAGTYFRDGLPAPGTNLKLDETTNVYFDDGSGYPTLAAGSYDPPFNVKRNLQNVILLDLDGLMTETGDCFDPNGLLPSEIALNRFFMGGRAICRGA